MRNTEFLVQVCLELAGSKNVDRLGVPLDWIEKHYFRRGNNSKVLGISIYTNPCYHLPLGLFITWGNLPETT